MTQGTGVWHPAAVRSAASTSNNSAKASTTNSSGTAAGDDGCAAPRPGSMPVGSPLSAGAAPLRGAGQLRELQRPGSARARERHNMELQGGGWHAPPARARTASSHSLQQQLSQRTAGSSHAAQAERYSSGARGWATEATAPAVPRPPPRRQSSSGSSSMAGARSASFSVHRTSMDGDPQKQLQRPADHAAASPPPPGGQRLLQLDEWPAPLLAHATHSGPLPAVAGLSPRAPAAAALHGCISEPLMRLDVLHGAASEPLPSPTAMAAGFGGLALQRSSLDDAIAAANRGRPSFDGLVLGWDGRGVAQQPPASPQTMLLHGDMQGVTAALQQYSTTGGSAGGTGLTTGGSNSMAAQLVGDAHWGSSPPGQLMQQHQQPQQQQLLQDNILQLRQARQRLAAATAALLHDSTSTPPCMSQHVSPLTASPGGSMFLFDGQLESGIGSSIGAGSILPDPPGLPSLGSASSSGIVLGASPPSQLPVLAQPLAQLSMGSSNGASMAGSPSSLAAEVAANKLQQLLHIQQRQRELKDELLQLLPLID